MGFAEKVSPSLGATLSRRSWGQWDGGKLGGRPLWLTLQGAPPAAFFACPCGKPYVLLAQVYAPLEHEDAGHAEAFHRMLYLLSCPSAACVNAAGVHGGVAVVRSQLPRANAALPYYEDDAIEHPAWEGTLEHPVCCLCGFPASAHCARCKRPRYCSRAHQVAHWRLGHKAECAAAAGQVAEPSGAAALLLGVQVGAALQEWDVDVEEEPSAEERARHAEETLPPEAAKFLRGIKEGSSSGGAAAAAEEEGGDGEPPCIKSLSQKKLNEAVGKAGPAADATLVEFEVRSACAQSQVMRYSGWWPNPPPTSTASAAATAPAAVAAASGGGGGGGGGGEVEKKLKGEGEEDEEEEVEEDGEDLGEGCGVPLWFSTAHQPTPSDIPPCSRCGAPRVFELQLMPQALHYLLPPSGAEEVGVSIDFGTLAVYTCSKSCPLGAEPFAKEVAWVQPAGAEEAAAEGRG